MADLLAGITPENRPGETFDDAPVGSEALLLAGPERGDLVWLTVNPQAGRGLAGRRPALALSPRAYHQTTACALVSPITSRQKGYPFEVPRPERLPVQGVVLGDQLKSIDRHAREIEVVGRAPAAVVAQVRARLWALLAA